MRSAEDFLALARGYVMRNFSKLVRALLLVLVAMASSGCVTYHLRDDVEVQDRLVEDSRVLVAKLVRVETPNVLLRLELAGGKRIERTTTTDRQVSYDAKSSLLDMIDEFGMTPGLVVGVAYGLVADVVQVAVSGPIVVVVGYLDSMDPADEVAMVVAAQDAELPANQEVLARLGPRRLQTVRSLKGSLILVDAREAARDALRQGRDRVTAQVRLKDGDLRATVVLGADVLRQLAGK